MLEKYAAKIAVRAAKYAPAILANPAVLVEAIPIIGGAAVIAYAANAVIECIENA